MNMANGQVHHPHIGGGEVMDAFVWNRLHTYTLVVLPREDIEVKIREFVQRARRNFFVINAIGVVSSVGIHANDETRIYFRQLEILNLAGIFSTDELGIVHGYLSISFCDIGSRLRAGRVYQTCKARNIILVILGTYSPLEFLHPEQHNNGMLLD